MERGLRQQELPGLIERYEATDEGDESESDDDDSPIGEMNTMKIKQVRQLGLTRLARAAHRRGMEPEPTQRYLLEANARRCVPPLHESEVLAIAARTIEGSDSVWGNVAPARAIVGETSTAPPG